MDDDYKQRIELLEKESLIHKQCIHDQQLLYKQLASDLRFALNTIRGIQGVESDDRNTKS